MADANGIIFRNPTLNTWFVGPTVDLTAWNVITVSGCSDGAFNIEYTYVPATAKWTNGIRNIWKDTLWYMSDGTITYTAPDNGLSIPPATFTRTLDYPLTITVVGAGSTESNGEYAYSSARWIKELPYRLDIYKTTTESVNYWVNGRAGDYYTAPDNGLSTPPKENWIVAEGYAPAPTLEYSLGVVSANVSSSSTATWASTSPTSGFVSLTDTPDEDFGYVISFDVQGGVAYSYYKYCTKAAGEVYGTLPEASRNNFIFAGWYTLPEGQGTRVFATTELVEAADHTLYAKWVKKVSGKVGCGACLVSLFALGIGTDIFCEYIGSRLAKTTSQTIVRKLPKP